MINLPKLREGWAAWLMSARVIGSDGSVVSWYNDEHPGYAYPEIAGLMLSFLGRYRPEEDQLAERIAARLTPSLGPAGGVMRGSTEYVFDSAMVLSGLLAGRQPGDSARSPLQSRLFAFITDRLRGRTGITGSVDDPDRWSHAYGCHLLKTSLAITAYVDEMEQAEQERAWSLLDQLVSDLAPLQTGGRFRIHERSARTYLHAHCYATEGLLCLRERGVGGIDTAIEESAEWLAGVQAAEGGIRAWHDGSTPGGPMHADASAQAIRIWALVDGRRYHANIEAGLAFLHSITHELGGLRYERDSDDVNTWATIFGWQAAEWADEPGSPLEII